MTGIAFRWLGATMPFASIVRKSNSSCRLSTGAHAEPRTAYRPLTSRQRRRDRSWLRPERPLLATLSGGLAPFVPKGRSARGIAVIALVVGMIGALGALATKPRLARHVRPRELGHSAGRQFVATALRHGQPLSIVRGLTN